MSFASFCSRVNIVCRKAKISVRFEHDKDNGRYVARLKDGTQITGNSTSKKVTVRWGNRGTHCSMAMLPA